MAKKRPTSVEYAQRIDEIYGLLLTRVGYGPICRYASKKWHVTTRQTDRYIAAARKRVFELLAPDQREQLAKALGSYETIFARQIATGDLRGARATMRDIVDLLGLGADERARAGEQACDLDAWLAELTQGEP